MRKLFKHNKEEDYESEAEYLEEEYYESGDEEPEEEYYESGDAEPTDEEYYEPEDAEAEEEEYYESEGAEAEEEEYYESEEDAYYSDDESDESEDGYYGIEEIGEPEEDDLEYYGEFAAGDADGEDEEESGFFGWLSSVSTLDMVMAGAGVCILLLAAIVGVMFVKGRSATRQTSVFASVGEQLDGIEVIGDEGLLAVADAALARQAAAKVVEDESKDPGYQEANYNKNVTVILKTVSVQKDLKIKFVNKNTEKLIANVPFQVSLVAPDNKTESWSDDDMDGIIYKKGITPGTYKITVTPLTGDKYQNYTLPAGEETAEVKKDIAYKKIDVSDEVKTEAEINVAQEEQKKQEPAVESSLQDTVEWVASTAVTSTYVEVSKSSVTDPLTTSWIGSFMRTAKEVKLSETSGELEVGKTLVLTPTYSLEDVASVGFSSSDASVVKVDAGGTVTALAPGKATITCAVTVVKQVKMEDGTEDTKETVYEAECEITVVEGETGTAGENTTKYSVSVKPASVSLTAGAEETAQITAGGFDTERELTYSVESSDIGVATATVDKNGKVTIKAVSSGKATITVSVNYSDNALSNPPDAQIAVTVGEAGEFSLSQTSATIYLGTPLDITASIDTAAGATITAKSSDTKVAEVSVSGKTVTITGIKAGTAKITVTASNGDSGTCAVTVKQHPKDDDTTPLKDNDGNQLYVLESNDTYREAVYADYYKDGVKFFKRGETKYTGWQTIDGKVYFYDKSGKKVTGEQVIQGAKYNFASDGSLVTGSGTMGIDVSKHNATIDWNAVKNSGVSYVIIRCGYRGYTQGSLVIDPKFEQNIKGATSAGLKVGVYFFSQAVDEVEAVQEASFVLDAVKGYKISYPIFLDVEYSGASGNSGRADGLDKATRTAVCRAFCATIQSGGYTAGVYANKNWLETKIDPGQLNSYKIWLAQYAATPTYAGRYDMWQYKSTGKVSGITGNVDMNISYLGY